MKNLCNFANDLYDKVVGQQGDQLRNVFFSPASIYSALAMVMLGSRGTTRDELIKALKLSTKLSEDKLHQAVGPVITEFFKANDNVEVTNACRLYVNGTSGADSDYQTKLQKYYQTECQRANIGENREDVRKEINQWISDETKEHVKEIVTDSNLKADADLILVNGLYFKGQWKVEFNTYYTKARDFWTLNNKSMKIDQMLNCKHQFGTKDLKEERAQAIKLDLRDPNWTMILVVPNLPNRLPNLLTHLRKPGAFDKIIRMEYDTCTYQIQLPRFKLTQDSNLSFTSVLKEMGINALFSPNNADISGIGQDAKPGVFDILHKAVLEVNEDGGPEPPISGGSINLMATIYKSYTVVQPFFFALIYNGMIPVFVGHCTEPEAL